MTWIVGLASNNLSVSANMHYDNEGQERSDNQERQEQRNNNNIAEQMLSTFFENLNYLEEQYGSNLVTVQDATDVYPILSQTNGGCPFDSRKFKMQQQEDKMPCYTPIVTIHDHITNP
ncbi:hypothetical protein QTG54_002490 [Skeletonema marinoi]|uniref:Uncharacterized protein n=1 Tax=Skeletonema marinoi TaxID=267567 RepID=A0AAD9DGQ8_9STRA|nr:hypothetical protein QTG54_002490 [Skeletonema marinoi]